MSFMIERLKEKIKAHTDDLFLVIAIILIIVSITGGVVLYQKIAGKTPILIQRGVFSP